jgi:Arc/MetJ family transcription regulator
MAKTLVDIDDVLLGQAADVLGTRTKKETVAAALEQAVKIARRNALVERFSRGEGYPDLGEPEVMAGAWR